MTFTYTGDSVGSPLTRDREYRIVKAPFQGVDYVLVEPVDGVEEQIKLTRTEWKTMEELDLIQ